MRATVILPVKRFARAKTRLVETIGRPGRAALLRAMLGDVLESLTGCAEVERIIVVTGEGRAERVALEVARRAATPIEVMEDPADPGHSEAATLGIIRALALGADCAALLPGDCPLVDTGEVDSALRAIEPGMVAVVADRHGSGTNGLIMAPADAIGPAFGPQSRDRHLDRAARAGHRATALEIPSLALDLDTADDLRELRRLLAHSPEQAPRTAAALAEL